MCVAPPGREQRGVQVHTDREASGEDAPEPQAGPAEAHHYGYDAPKIKNKTSKLIKKKKKKYNNR
jgi:hypothetical protein